MIVARRGLPVVLGIYLATGGLGFAGGRPGDAKPAPAKAAELPADAVARFGTPFPRQGRPINFCAFTGDGRSLITAGGDGVHVWDPETGVELRRFTSPPESAIATADLSADGTRLATICDAREGLARVYDVATGRKVCEVVVHAPLPASIPEGTSLPWFAYVRLSPDGKKLAYFCCREARIAVYDVESGSRLFARDAAKRRVWDVAFLPDGRHVISGGDEQVLRIWDAATGEPVREVGSALGEIGRIAVSPTGDRLATISHRQTDAAVPYWRGDDFIRLWDAKTGKVLRQIRVPPGASHADFASGLNALAFTRDGKRLVAGGLDRATRVFDAATGDELRRIPEAAGIPGRLAVSPDGKRYAFVTATLVPIPRTTPLPKGALRMPVAREKILSALSPCFHLRDLETGRDLRAGGHEGSVVLSALSPDGRFAATAAPGREILIWDASTGRKVRSLVGHEKEVMALAWVDAGPTLLSAGTDGTLRTWDAATGKEVRKVAARGAAKIDWLSGPRGRAEFSPDGKLLAVVSEDGGVVITETATGKEAHSLDVRSGAASHVRFTADGATLLIVTTESFAYSWDTREGLELRSCEVRDPGHSPYLLLDQPCDAVLSPDGKTLVISRVDDTLVMIDTATERVLGLKQRIDYGPSRLALSPDGHTLAWGGGPRESQIILYEMATGRERKSLQGHVDRVLSLSFSADGRRLLSGSADGTALLWDVTGKAGGGAEVALTRRELSGLWADLAGDDPEKGYAAVRSLAASPKTAVPYLRSAFTPARHVDEGQVARLIADLSGDEADKQKKALDDLDEVGEPALPQVRKALEGRPAAATQRRLRQLVDWNYRESTAPSPARLRELRALEALQLAGTPEAWKVVEELARGDPGARRTQLAKSALATRPAKGQ